MESIENIWTKLIALNDFFREDLKNYLNSNPNINLMEIKEIQNLWSTYEKEKFYLPKNVQEYLYEEIIRKALVERFNNWITLLNELIILRNSGNSKDAELKLNQINEEVDSIIFNYSNKLVEFRRIGFLDLYTNKENNFKSKKELKGLIAKGEIKIVFEDLKNRFSENNEIIAQLGRLSELNKQIRLDVATKEDIERDRNKLRYSLLELIDEKIEENES